MIFFTGIAFSCFSQDGYKKCKVLFIPLDDRPPCLQFPEKMGLIGDIKLVSPPKEMLGKFTTLGKSDKIIEWIYSQNLEEFDAAIISIDMLAYGGLVGSRIYDVNLETVQKRLEIIELIRNKSPKIKIYGSSVMMRLAPTADGKNEAYREKLARWAEISADPTEKEITQNLEKEIPAEALQSYKEARIRNLKVNELAIHLIQKGIFDYLILSQDDAKPRGVHIKERESLIEQIKQRNLSEKIAVQPGADEVSMLLLARVIAEKFNYRPTIKAIYSSENMADKEMPFEDRPLRKTVSFHIKATGATEVESIEKADILFYVFTSRFEKGRAESFANQILKAKKGVIIADIDPRGDVQGGDTTFNEILKKGNIFSKIYGYACWNTAGNTIGTALPHGFVYGFSQKKFGKKQRKSLEIHQKWFVLNRLLDDYAYHSIIRPKANQQIRAKGLNSFRLDDEQTKITEAFCIKELMPIAHETFKAINSENKNQWGLESISFKLPWNRTFEAEIDCSFLKNN